MPFSILNEFIVSIVLGVVQGVSEFLPISSTAHLRLISGLFLDGRDIGLSAGNIIQLGTLIALIQYFRNDLSSYFSRLYQVLVDSNVRKAFLQNFKSWWSNKEVEKINQTDIAISQVIVGSIPIFGLGYLLKLAAENYRDLNHIAWFLILGSVVMGIAEIVYSRQKKEKLSANISPKESLIIGTFQALAALPGVSRSGATISGGLILAKDRVKAVRFSFLLSIPALTILSILDFIEVSLFFVENGFSLLPQSGLWTESEVNLAILSLFVSFLVAYAVGLIVLKWLLRYLSRNSFTWFIVYRIFLSLVLFLSLVSGV